MVTYLAYVMLCGPCNPDKEEKNGDKHTGNHIVKNCYNKNR